MALMVSNGANAGNLSFSVVGVIVEAQMLKAGISGAGWVVFFANFAAHAAVAGAAVLLFRDPLLIPRRSAPAVTRAGHAPPSRSTWVTAPTLAVLAVWMSAAVVGRAPRWVCPPSAAAAVLDRRRDRRRARPAFDSVVRAAELLRGEPAGRRAGRTGGMDLMTDLLARLATPGLANGVLAFVTGLISTDSSTSGAVIPRFFLLVGRSPPSWAAAARPSSR
jgi:hypothetical protein